MSLTPLNEDYLLKQLKCGNEVAFERLYHIYSAPVYKKLLRLLKQEALAQEILQDVFVKVWQKREAIDINKSFRCFLNTVASNMATDIFRRAAYDRVLLQQLTIVLSTQVHNPVEDYINVKDGQAILHNAIEKLPPQRKKVFILCKIEGKSYEEVSNLLGISTSTISDHIVKATRTLKTHFTSNEIALSAILAIIIASY